MQLGDCGMQLVVREPLHATISNASRFTFCN
jgi:hypothetical protein